MPKVLQDLHLIKSHCGKLECTWLPDLVVWILMTKRKREEKERRIEHLFQRRWLPSNNVLYLSSVSNWSPLLSYAVEMTCLEGTWIINKWDELLFVLCDCTLECSSLHCTFQCPFTLHYLVDNYVIRSLERTWGRSKKSFWKIPKRMNSGGQTPCTGNYWHECWLVKNYNSFLPCQFCKLVNLYVLCDISEV